MTMMCPNCGYCPHCGRGQVARPPYWPTPLYPQGPIYTTPSWVQTTIQPGMVITGGHFVPTNATHASNGLGANITFTNTQGTNTQ